MFVEGQIILFRSFKIQDKWYEGEVTKINIKSKDIQYVIKTDLGGIHSEVFRFSNDVKTKK